MEYLKRTNAEYLVCYSVYKNNSGLYILLLDIIKGGAIERDPKFLKPYRAFEEVHQYMVEQGFIPFVPRPEDPDSLICSYI